MRRRGPGAQLTPRIPCGCGNMPVYDTKEVPLGLSSAFVCRGCSKMGPEHVSELGSQIEAAKAWDLMRNEERAET